VRARIAADLHDEIGSTLSSISIFSEMARQEVFAVSPGTTHYLSRIGEISRAALESFDDIVWAINPANETLYDLLLRVREFAIELFEAQGIDFIARIPRGTRTTGLPMDTRRQLYLMCKEALTNVAKHSRCQHATLELLIENTLLTLTVRDDGVGFRLGSDGQGNGLINLRKRAAAVGGTLTVESEETKGTTVRLQLRIT
jgi:signal transduction histidine kinase